MSDSQKCKNCPCGNVASPSQRSGGRWFTGCETAGCWCGPWADTKEASVELWNAGIADVAVASKLAPQPVGDGVEVRASVGMSRDGCYVVYGSSAASEAMLIRPPVTGEGRRHVAWITARVPLPTIPTVRGMVEGVKADE